MGSYIARSNITKSNDPYIREKQYAYLATVLHGQADIRSTKTINEIAKELKRETETYQGEAPNPTNRGEE
jgi:hypothetical protein